MVAEDQVGDDDPRCTWPECWVGTDCDVRAIAGTIPPEAKDEFRYDEVPWRLFSHSFESGEEIPGLLIALSALHGRLTVEANPVVQASLVLAIAQLALENHDESARAWTHGLWSDPDRPHELRVSAGLAWLCLVEDAATDELCTLLADSSTDQLNDLFQQVPWIGPVDFVKGQGLRRCIDQMLTPGGDNEDPWA